MQNEDKEDENNTYITTFKVGFMDKKDLIGFLIISYYLNSMIYDELRNKRNLGYVADAFGYTS